MKSMNDREKFSGQSFSRQPQQQGAADFSEAGRRKNAPPTETNAEIYYYKKQIDSHTLMAIVLQDGEEIEGTIEWYDREALKVNRKDAPNVMILKHNIKYMYKAEDR
jgi:sRNA-binding regulator protein Hfq